MAFSSCARPTGIRDRALREHRESTGFFLLLFLFPVWREGGGSD